MTRTWRTRPWCRPPPWSLSTSTVWVTGPSSGTTPTMPGTIGTLRLVSRLAASCITSVLLQGCLPGTNLKSWKDLLLQSQNILAQGKLGCQY